MPNLILITVVIKTVITLKTPEMTQTTNKQKKAQDKTGESKRQQ